ncbi:hypothetical protein N7489_004128 [Penicillium chrysogenum]|uniref:uncharacterized protein n=1 Tax=Penicillium chrysogenum TaxID=5076 RepID=UPI0024DF09B0|nr:uncharacterized protein N7489_004128 [Penicillium chrysogenum]KAJ5244032.1 hypothetical protein N7489_004128 [Penicillium chrysogenum]
MSFKSLELVHLPLFKPIPEHTPDHERTYISYQRAAAVVKIYGLTAVDVLQFTQKFWNLHLDLVGALDCAAFTLMTIQINLAGGTLAPFAGKHPQYRKLLDQILNFDISIMPPAAPVKDFPRVGIVFARLIVSGEDRGIRPFITWLSDGEHMCDGVTAKLLPRRAASKPVDHAITTFTHVRLPQSALLGSLDKPKDMRKEFLSSIWRIRVGSVALPLQMIAGMKRGVFVAGKYSQRRHILGPDQKPKPIISFRTQHGPILHALAQLSVFDAYAQHSMQYFKHPNVAAPVQHAIGAMLKAILYKTSQACLFTLSERCGAQGLFENNHIIEAMLETRAMSIAEGDTLVLSIRLTSEILLNRHNMPSAKDPTSLLAKHEQGLLDELRGMTMTISGGHRGEDFDRLVLPRSQEFVEAMGHRIAYEAAIEAGVHSDLVALYEIWVILQNQGWFVQHTSLTRERMFQVEADRLSVVLPQLDTLLDATGAEPYCSAPIASQASWDHFVDQLETKTGSRTTNIDLLRGGAML